MALEATHHNQYSPQIITNNREFVKIDETQLNNYAQMGYANPFATTMENPWLGPYHQSLGMNNTIIQPHTNFVKAESGLPTNMPNGPRKRSRDSMEDQFNNLNVPPITNNVPIQGFAPPNTFPHNVQHLWDIDYTLSQFNKNLNMDLETQVDRDMKFALAYVTSRFVKGLKLREEQLRRMSKLNMELQERVKSLHAETQHWKDVANTAERNTMALRKDLDNILGKVSILNGLMPTNNAVAVEEDAESCYGSTDFGKNINQGVVQGTTRNSEFIDKNRMCKKCGERESSVLLLPCRHLCLCSVCGGSLQATCSVCNSCTTTTVHVCLT